MVLKSYRSCRFYGWLGLALVRWSVGVWCCGLGRRWGEGEGGEKSENRRLLD
jgi:hypothetical protein